MATSYRRQDGRRVTVADDSVVRVLAALGVDASTPSAAAAALDQRAAHDARHPVPPTVVVWRGTPTGLPVPAGTTATLGGTPLAAADGALVLPADLPVGWHRLELQEPGGSATAWVVAAPASSRRGRQRARSWGLVVQLYALRSAGSWGIGELADLDRLVGWTAAAGGDLLLCNPLHAGALVAPVEASPYFPTSRRFVSPLYLRVEALPEYAAAAADVRTAVDDLAARARALSTGDRVDRDAVWSLKSAALQRLFDAAGPAVPGDPGRDTFALWCALAERHGRDWRRWPAELRHPDGPAVARARDGLADRVRFHAWLQVRAEEQLAAVHRAARAGGMRLGVVHDLAVGVDPGGADAWALQDSLAVGVTVGAPPDSFNQQGQDWQLPPWRPDRLAATGYAAYRDTLAATFRHAGGIRVDHVLGMFRMWWIPAGCAPRDGTYVRYDADALLAALLVEAAAADALVVGEDLGTVEPRVTAALRRRGVLGTSVLWFERDGAGRLRAPGEWRARSVATATTHDLPTVAGFLHGEHVRIREELGLLTDPAAEWAAFRREREELVALLRHEGLLDAGASDEDVVVAIHALVGRTRSRIRLVSPADGVGDRRQPNLPGTTDEYPNWRLPVADGQGRPVSLEQVLAHPLLQRVVAAL